jgi:hypothetical protein
VVEVVAEEDHSSTLFSCVPGEDDRGVVWYRGGDWLQTSFSLPCSFRFLHSFFILLQHFFFLREPEIGLEGFQSRFK